MNINFIMARVFCENDLQLLRVCKCGDDDHDDDDDDDDI